MSMAILLEELISREESQRYDHLSLVVAGYLTYRRFLTSSGKAYYLDSRVTECDLIGYLR